MNVSLMDSAQASLNTTSAKNSLEYLFKDIYTSINSSVANTDRLNIDINKSVAFCDHAMTMVQNSTDLNTLHIDSFAADYREGNWWYSLGSSYYPSQMVSDEKLAYHQSLITFDKLSGTKKNTSVTWGDFRTRVPIYSVSLERDTQLALSQSPVNSSRALRFECKFDIAPPFATTNTVFMVYLTSVRSSLLSSRVDI